MPTNFVSIQGKVHNFVDRLLESGKRVATFSVGFGDAGKKGTFSYVNVSAWNLSSDTVEALSNNWQGTVLVVGKLKQETWEGKQGKRSEVKVIADEVTLVPVREREQQEESPPAPVAKPVQKAPAPAPVAQPRPVQTKPVQQAPAPKPQPQQPQRNTKYVPAPQKKVAEPVVEIQDDKPWVDDDQEDSYSPSEEDVPF